MALTPFGRLPKAAREAWRRAFGMPETRREGKLLGLLRRLFAPHPYAIVWWPNGQLATRYDIVRGFAVADLGNWFQRRFDDLAIEAMTKCP